MTAHVALAFALAATTPRAECPPRPDELSAAYLAALQDLHAGKDRKAVADKLTPAIDKNPKSEFHPVASSFLADLAVSAKNPPPKPDAPPENRLAETRIRRAELLPENADEAGARTGVERLPNDPAVRLLADRADIARLIPLITDCSPTRSDDVIEDFRDPLPQARVCEIAVMLIEHHARCPFFHHRPNAQGGPYLHQLDEAGRERVAKRIREWWAEVKDKSVAAGVRAQIPHAVSVEVKVVMAQTISRLDKGRKTDDREFALTLLRDVLKKHPVERSGFWAFLALGEFQDASVVGILYDTGKAALARPDPIGKVYFDAVVTLHLCEHATRRSGNSCTRFL